MKAWVPDPYQLGRHLTVRDILGDTHQGNVKTVHQDVWVVLTNGDGLEEWIHKKHVVSVKG